MGAARVGAGMAMRKKINASPGTKNAIIGVALSDMVRDGHELFVGVKASRFPACEWKARCAAYVSIPRSKGESVTVTCWGERSLSWLPGPAVKLWM